MSDNSLLTTRWAKQFLDREWAETEAIVLAYLAEHPETKISDLTLEFSWRTGSYRVRVITAEERWMNWFSENDG